MAIKFIFITPPQITQGFSTMNSNEKAPNTTQPFNHKADVKILPQFLDRLAWSPHNLRTKTDTNKAPYPRFSKHLLLFHSLAYVSSIYHAVQNENANIVDKYLFWRTLPFHPDIRSHKWPLLFYSSLADWESVPPAFSTSKNLLPTSLPDKPWLVCRALLVSGDFWLFLFFSI